MADVKQKLTITHREKQKMSKNIVFDMDGVLIDSEALILKIWKKIALEEGIENIESTLMQCIGITAPETEALFLKVYGKDFPYERLRKQASEIFHATADAGGLPVKPGVYDLFDFLKENNFRIGLASSTREAVVRSEMESLGLLKYFHIVVCGDMVTHSKPHPEIYLKACELLGAVPADCYAVEDSPNGIRSARAAGMKPLMVPDLLAPDEEIQRLYFRKFENLLEVRDFLAKQTSF